LRLLGPLPDDGVPRREGIDHNVVPVGGGQNGCAYAFARRCSGRVAVIDPAPDAASAGLWRHRARMLCLRTPKNLVGPELDVTALGFQA
jgi:cation diffusion facilitator CzcD-associated flavoprotein CzcO